MSEDTRDDSGKFRPGTSGNPGGRPRDEHGIAELARSHGRAALERLVQLKDSKDERVSLSASIALLDRGYGKPKQAQEISLPDDGQGLITVIKRVIVGAAGKEGGDGN